MYILPIPVEYLYICVTAVYYQVKSLIVLIGWIFRRNCLVCIGLVDGNVAVLNLEKDEDNATQCQVLKNVPVQIKHSCPVWSVKWGDDDIDGNPVFYSGGMDGKVLLWTLDVPDLQGLGGLIGAEVSTLTLPIPAVSGPDGTTFNLFGNK